jgi:hypothetical protein
MQSFPEIDTCPSRLLVPEPVMVPPTNDPQLKLGEVMVSWMTEPMDSAALPAFVEIASGAAIASISKADVMVLFIVIVFIVLYSPVKSIE